MATEHKSRDIKNHDKGTYYGAPPDYFNVPIGTVFKNRAQLAEARVHMEQQKGIHACKDGAYAVVVNGGYQEDVDKGELVEYAGEGEPEKENLAGLYIYPFRHGKPIPGIDWECWVASKTTKYRQTPVRLIRGSKANPQYAPPDGYFVYHGLYDIVGEPTVRTRTDETKVLIFQLKRRPDQLPLPETGLQPRLTFWKRPEEEVEQSDRIGNPPKSKIPAIRIPKNKA